MSLLQSTVLLHRVPLLSIFKAHCCHLIFFDDKGNRRSFLAHPHPWVLIFNEHVQQYQSKRGKKTCAHAYTEMVSAWCEQVSVANANWSAAWVSEPSCFSVQQLTNAYWQSRNPCFCCGGGTFASRVSTSVFQSTSGEPSKVVMMRNTGSILEN